MHKKIPKILRSILLFWGIYLLFEAAIYLFDIRLIDTRAVWQFSAITYAQYIDRILGSIFLFLSIIILEIQKDLKKYKKIIVLSSFWAFFHGMFLVYLSVSQNYVKIYENIPSLYVWFPLYTQYVSLEGLFLIIYSILFLFNWYI